MEANIQFVLVSTTDIWIWIQIALRDVLVCEEALQL